MVSKMHSNGMKIKSSRTKLIFSNQYNLLFLVVFFFLLERVFTRVFTRR